MSHIQPPTSPPPKRHFDVDARAILTLGRDSIKDHITAVLELVKNSYDADASLVEIEVVSDKTGPYIRIADNGLGMTNDDIDNRWLRIGFSSKKGDGYTPRGRRRTGEKGIGRISADRLGSMLRLNTKTKTSPSISIEVEWDRFNVSGQTLQSVDIETIEPATIRLPEVAGVPSASGTELLITGLRQEWTDQEIDDLRTELSLLTPPFEKVKDFEIHLRSGTDTASPEIITSPFFQAAEIRLTVDFDGTSLSYKTFEREPPRGLLNLAKSGTFKWEEIIQKPRRQQELFSYKPHCGPARVELLFYPRKPTILTGTKFSLGDLRTFLDSNAGVKIYRDTLVSG